VTAPPAHRDRPTSPAALLVAAVAGVAALIALAPALAIAGPAPAPVPPALAATAAALYAPQTGQMLLGVDDRRELPIASTTKLMTALITLQHVHRLSTMFTQNDWYPSAVDSQIGLVPGERMSVHDLLLALMLPSADDAAEDLAYNVGHGSVARFVAMMNAEARRLGLTDTHYATPIGLDTPGNYSSAADLVRLADYDLEHSSYFARIVALPEAVLHTGPVGVVVNRNDLVGRVPWIDGVKTGHTDDAGYVLVASGRRGGMTLISAVLGTASEQARDAETLAALDYGFDDFALRTPVRAGAVLARPAVAGRPGVHVALIAAGSFVRVLPADQPVTVRVQAPRRLRGPLRARRREGTAVVLAGAVPIARLPLLLSRSLARPPASRSLAAQILRGPLGPLAILLALAAGVAAIGLHRRRTGSARVEMEAA
jgi:D-alanyl-D-alanine carboxypeptidase (penicillin-binding protein 5/6)